MSELGIDYSGLKEEDRAYIDEYVAKKICTLEDAVEFSKREMRKLKGAISNDAEIHYIRGEEDRKNMEQIEELLIPKILSSPQVRKQILEKSEQELKDALEKMRKQRKTLESQQEKLQKKRAQHKRRSENYTKLTQDINAAREEERLLAREIHEREVEIAKVKHEIQVSAPLSKVFNRKSISPDVSEVLYRLAKNEYLSSIHEIFRGWTDKFYSHTSNEIALEIDGVKFVMRHSTKDSSDSPAAAAIKDLRWDLALRNIRKYLDADAKLPDVVLTAHGKYGGRVQWQPSTEEPIGEGQPRSTPQATTNIQLPTFQSPAFLQKLTEKLPRNLHVRRFKEGMYGAGAVLHRFYGNDVQEVEFVSVPELVKYGKVAEQIRELQQKLRGRKSGKLFDETRKEITALEDLVRAPASATSKSQDAAKPILIETYSDVHLGSNTWPGRPTPGELSSWAINYQKLEERLPDILFFGGDILHGILKHTSANAQYIAKTPSELRHEAKRIRARTDLGELEKEKAITELYKHAHDQLNVTNLAKQREEFIYTFKPYCQEVLRNGGRIVFVSGNHFNKTTKSSGGEAVDDEAFALAQMLEGYETYKANGQIVMLHGLGEEYGLGTVPLGDGKELFATHEPGSGSDPALALMKKLINEYRSSHIAIAGHLHVPTVAFAEGRTAVECPGMQSWSQYLDLYSANASLRGKINVEVDPKREWTRVRGIFDPTLERPEYR